MSRLRLSVHRPALLGQCVVPAMSRLTLPMGTFIRAMPGLVAALPLLLLVPLRGGIAGCRRLAALLPRLLALTAVPP